MYRRFLVFICKILIKLLRLIGRNGSALPGLIIERLDPKFLEVTLKPVEKQIILVTGTNGKTTTTKMLVTALRGCNRRVITNKTGSNMTRGLIAALVEDMTYHGSLKPTDWFVFEMDEAYAPIFAKNVSPKLLVGLNVLRDQLDRYGEIDKTARLIEAAATEADIFVYNELDPLLTEVAVKLRTKKIDTASFGVAKSLLSEVANEQTIHGQAVVAEPLSPLVELLNHKETKTGQTLVIEVAGKQIDLNIPLQGFHNALNTTAVLTVLQCLEPEKFEIAAGTIPAMPIPFGRGERLQLKGKNITVALVKNPSAFASNLETFVKKAQPEAVLFVVNDRFADGRDVSWLWDVNFKDYLPKNTTIYSAGIRGYDMALRLKQDNIDSKVETSVAKVIQIVMKSKYSNVVIVPTYTALFEVRAALSNYGKVPRIW